MFAQAIASLAVPALALLVAATPAQSQQMGSGAFVGDRLIAEILDRDGRTVGSAAIRETPSGVIWVTVLVNELEPGEHGVHLHETGLCEGDFTSAGEHIADGRNHGLVEGGPHPGDLPNGIVGGDGELAMEAFALPSLSFEEHLMDSDGAAIIIHSDADDYITQPAGDAGDRVACGVLVVERES
jgi:Cu-Zn family superoxide dismutase